jgi:hypothetical protein
MFTALGREMFLYIPDVGAADEWLCHPANAPRPRTSSEPRGEYRFEIRVLALKQPEGRAPNFEGVVVVIR